MNLEVYFTSTTDKPLVGKVTGIQESPVLYVVRNIDTSKLLACERQGSYDGPSSPIAGGPLSMENFEPLRLRVEIPGQPHQFVTVKSIIQRKNGIVGSNFGTQLRNWRDLKFLPRIVDLPEATTEEGKATNDDIYEFLNSIAHALVLDLDKDHEAELARELKHDAAYILYPSWKALAKDTSWEAVRFLIRTHKLWEWKESLARKMLVLELNKNIKNTEAMLEEDDSNASLIHHQMAFEQFVQQFPNVHHTRDAQSFYFETEPSERTSWIPYDPDSVFVKPISSNTVSHIHSDGKASRDMRHELILKMFHKISEKCKEHYYGRWEFSKHFWMQEEVQPGVLIPNWEMHVHMEELFRAPQPVKPKANVYTRFGLAQRTSRNDTPGSGIRIVKLESDRYVSHSQAINSLYRQVFRTNKAWRDTRQGMLSKADSLKKSPSKEDRQKEAELREKAARMGVFLTQDQLHTVRVLTKWLYERFDVPQEERKQTEEKYAVSESRLNDIFEEGRKVEAKLELLMHELAISSRLSDLRNIQNLQGRLQHQAKGNIYQQKQIIQNMLAEKPSNDLRDRLIQLAEREDEVTMQQLETLADRLEQEVRTMMDPAYAEYNCELSTTKLILGKLGLHKRIQGLKEKLEAAPNPNRAEDIMNMLMHLEDRLEFCQASENVFLEDLPFKVKRQLGLEVEGE